MQNGLREKNEKKEWGVEKEREINENYELHWNKNMKRFIFWDEIFLCLMFFK